MEEKATRKAAVNEAMESIRDQVKSCSEAIKELKKDRKDQIKLMDENHKQNIKLINDKHKESLKTIDTAQKKLNDTLKKLNKYKKNPNVELDDVVLLQKKKNTSSALKKSAKLERKNSKKELKEASKAAKLERKNSEKELKEASKAAKLERKNSEKELKEMEKAAKLERKNSEKELKQLAKLERKNSAKNLKEMEKSAKLERKNSEKEMKMTRKLERKNSQLELKEAIKREELEAKEAALSLKKKQTSDFEPSKRAALLVSTNDTKRSSANATMKNFLIKKLGFEESDILCLSNMTKNANKMKILESLDNIIECANEKDCEELWFFYSGNGTVVKDVKSEDYEDAIIPCDYKEKGVINSMTFNSRMENIASNVKVNILFDCCHNDNFLETLYEYSGGSDMLTKFEEPRNYNANIKMFSLRTLELNLKTRGIVENENPHILARTFIEHYNECVEDNCSDVTAFSMLHDIRDYMVFNEIDIIPVLYCPEEVKNNTVLLSIE